MRRIFVTVLLLVLAGLAPAQTSPAGNWIKHDSVAGGFTVLFPVAPEETSHTKTIPQGDVASHLFMANDGQFLCLASYTDYPFDINVEQELNLDRDNFVKEVGATVSSSQRTSFPRGPNEKFPSLEFVATNANGTFKGLVVVVNRRAYLVVTFNRNGSNRAADGDRFFASFKLTSKKS
jgi:hypothetical protein